ncbi:MAG: hypothetical protein V3W44_10805 [Dehalococcoidales bacterium]
MNDKNDNLIPDRIDRAALKVGSMVTTVLGGLVTYLTSVDQVVPMWAGIACIVVPAIMTYFAFSGGGK